MNAFNRKREDRDTWRSSEQLLLPIYFMTVQVQLHWPTYCGGSALAKD